MAAAQQKRNIAALLYALVGPVVGVGITFGLIEWRERKTSTDSVLAQQLAADLTVTPVDTSKPVSSTMVPSESVPPTFSIANEKKAKNHSF